MAKMENKFVELFSSKKNSTTVVICVNNILYFEQKTNGRSRLYLVDGTVLDVEEDYYILKSALNSFSV